MLVIPTTSIALMVFAKSVSYLNIYITSSQVLFLDNKSFAMFYMSLIIFLDLPCQMVNGAIWYGDGSSGAGYGYGSGRGQATSSSECCRICKESTTCQRFSFRRGASPGTACELSDGNDNVYLKVLHNSGSYISSPVDISECSCGKVPIDLDIFSDNNLNGLQNLFVL